MSGTHKTNKAIKPCAISPQTMHAITPCLQSNLPVAQTAIESIWDVGTRMAWFTNQLSVIAFSVLVWGHDNTIVPLTLKNVSNENILTNHILEHDLLTAIDCVLDIGTWMVRITHQLTIWSSAP
jgi:hypothetical protein